MIRLILTSKEAPKTYTFEKPLISIGRPSAEIEQLDLILPGGGASGIQVLIEEVKGHFIAFNKSNHPLTTLNEMPFGKKRVKNGDLIEIEESLFIFEGYPSKLLLPEANPPLEMPPQTSFLSEKSHMQQKNADDELESLLREVEALEVEAESDQASCQAVDVPQTNPLPLPVETTVTAPSEESSSAYGVEEIDKQLTEQRDKPKKHLLEAAQTASESPFRYRAFFSLIMGIIFLLSTVAIISYTIIKERSEEEEVKAAAAVADVAMALNFAQINHAKPQNQNWSDPEFLKNNLTAILAAEFKPLSIVNPHGRFHNSPYMLRIYTGRNLSHFLVIAQPSPSLMQWLVPKSTIIVDSQSMQLRKTDNLKTLNHLLINATLDDSNSADIANLLLQAELIPLSLLKKYYGNIGFTTPKALASIRPGAENFIYNATRYYHLGESLIKKAISLYESHDDHADVPLLLQEINEFMKFPDIVLYTSEGLQTALLGQKAIATFLPKYKLLFGYLQPHSKQGLLLIDQAGEEAEEPAQALLAAAEQEDAQKQPPEENTSDSTDILATLLLEKQKALQSIDEQLASLSTQEKAAENAEEILRLNKQYRKIERQFLKRTLIALSLLSTPSAPEDDQKLAQQLESESEAPLPADKETTNESDLEHPLYYRLTALKAERQEKLQKIKGDISLLTDARVGHSATLTSKTKLQHLEREYQKTELELQKKMAQSIAALQQEYSEMPITQFMGYVRSAGLEQIIERDISSPLATEELDAKITEVDEAATLQQLSQRLSEIYPLLNMEHFPYPALLKTYQNKVRASTLRKLDLLLLSSHKLLPEEERREVGRKTLQNIFKKAWIIDEDEIDYYLNEFDLLIHHE